MPGIWLDDDTYQQTAGQIWAQGATQQLHAGEQWAQQALQAAVQPVQQGMDALSRLQAMVPSVPQQTPAPVSAPTPEPGLNPTPASPPTPEPTPTPQTPPIPVGQTPTAEPMPTPTPPAQTSMPTPPQPEPQPIQVPTPAPAQSPVSAGEDWAQQQIQNLLQPNPAQASPQTPPTPTAAPQPVPGLSASPSPTPGAPSGPQSSAPGDLVDQARQAATAAGIDPDIFSRQIQQESGFNPNARSGAGALGIAQFMPATAKGLGVDPMDPQAALTAAAQLDAQNLSKYGGDWSKALAAYNAGGGNVDKYGGVPPFSETQNYVNTILGGAKDLVQQAVQTGQTAVNTAVQGVQSAVARTSQFSMGLSSGDAMAFCGPAAALAFAQTYGRNPTVDEAKQLAQQVGWNPGQGMAGPSSEVKLLNAMGIDAHMSQGVDWQQVGQDAAGGNPVIIDTPGHYYYVDGYNQDTGKFHVGTSGTDLRGGSEWMSADQIDAMPQSGGSARAAIFADHPLSGPGQAATMAQAQPLTMGGNQPASATPDLGSVLGGGGSVVNTLSGLGQLAPDFGTGFMLQQGQKLSAQLLSAPEVQNQAQNVAQAVLNVGGQAGQAAGRATQDFLGQTQSILSPFATDISQAPQSLGDMLSSNALLSQGIPTVQGALSAVPDVSAQGIAGGIQNALSPVASGVSDYLQQLDAYQAQHPEIGGGRIDWTQPLGPQLGVDPYGQIVQQGIPHIVQGVQQGNLGDILGGGVQTLLGAASALPGAGGPEAAVARDLLPAVTETAAQPGGLPAYLSSLLRSRIGPAGVAPESAAVLENVAPGALAQTQQQLLADINAAAARRIAQDDLLRSINADAAQRIAMDDFLRDPANYDEYGVLKGFQPPNPITYDQYGVRTDFAPQSAYSPRGVEIDPLTGQELVPPDVALPTAPSLSQRLQGLTDQVNASMGTPLGGAQLGQASPAFARLLGGAAAGGLGGYELTDPNDPNRGLKIAAAAGLGGLAGGPGLDVLMHAGNVGAAPGATIPLGDWISGIYRGGVIGGLNTMADVVANSTLTPALSGVAGVARDLASFQPGRLQGRALGAQAGIVDWTNNFLQGLSGALSRPGTLSARAAPGAPTILANLVEGAGALHGAFQNATSELMQSMERGAAAGEGASSQGLQGQAWYQHFQNLLQNPDPAVAARAQAMGDRTAARGDLGTLTSAFGRFVNAAGPVGDALFPVYRMGMALASRMVESTPLGLAGTATDVARGLAGQGPYAALETTGLRGALNVTPASSAVGPIGERLTNNLIGTALSMWLGNQAIGGAITGSGPGDPGEHQVWLANGNQPDSFRTPDGTYHSWEKLPPALRGPMMAAGAYADAVQAYNRARAVQGTAAPQAYGVQDPRVAAAAQLVSEVGQQLASATPMRTFANIYDALQSNSVTGVGLTAAGDVASGILGGAVPASGLVRSIAEMTDPLQRQALRPEMPQQLPQSVLENVAENIPGLRENLPSRQDILGRQVSNPLQGLGQLVPVRTAAGQPSPVLQAMQTAGVTPTAAPSTIPYGPFDEIRLTPQEQQTWQRLRGQLVQQTATTMVNSPEFQREPLKSQQMSLNLVDQIATNAANVQMLSLLGSSAAARASARPGALTAPVIGYSPDVMANQVMLEQQLQRNAQHQALMQSLLGESTPSGLQSLQAANVAAAGAV